MDLAGGPLAVPDQPQDVLAAGLGEKRQRVSDADTLAAT
jgi:hypothetical protein